MTSSSSADVVVVGGGTVGAWTAVLLAESGVERVVLLARSRRWATGPAAAPRAWCAPRAAPKPPSCSACGPRSSTPQAATASRSTAASFAQGYLMPCFADAEVQQAHDRIALQQRLGLDVQWLSSSDIDDRNTGLGAGRHPRRVLRARRRLHRRTAQRAGLHGRADRAPASTSGNAAAFTGLRTAGGRVVGVDTSGRADRHRTRRADRRPQARRGRCDGGRASSGGRRAAPGGGDRTGRGDSTCTRCRWCST